MGKIIQSKNVINAVKKQERLNVRFWIVGFTDGEGCFSVSIIKNKTTKTGWQIFPEFVITQGKKSLSALETIKSYFNCGSIVENKRYDNHREPIYKYCVRNQEELNKIIIPFFAKHKLLTNKNNDFLIFKQILEMMSNKKHLTDLGFKQIAKLIEKMNTKKKSRYLKSSETKRQASS